MALNTCKRSFLPAVRFLSRSSAVFQDENDKSPSAVKEKGLLSRILTGQSADDHLGEQSHSTLLTAQDMVYAVVTDDTRRGKISKYLRIYERYSNVVQDRIPAMELVGSFEVIFGRQDQIVHLWRFKNGYEGVDQYLQTVRNDKELLWLKREQAKLCSQRKNSLCRAFSYWGDPKPRTGDHIYDLRTYVLKPGQMIEWATSWAKGIHFRRDHHQDLGGFFTQVGQLYTVFHFWAYPDMATRKESRETVWQKQGWNDVVVKTVPLIQKMDAKIMLPTRFSPTK